jgi:hypothetical protein
LLVVAVLAVPILARIPTTLHHEGAELRQNRHVDVKLAEVAAPFFRGGARRPERNDEVRFLLAVRKAVPPDATIGVVANPGQRWVRWAAWALAPRLVVPGTATPWLMLRDQQAGSLGRSVVSIGRFRLVRR